MGFTVCGFSGGSCVLSLWFFIWVVLLYEKCETRKENGSQVLCAPVRLVLQDVSTGERKWCLYGCRGALYSWKTALTVFAGAPCGELYYW